MPKSAAELLKKEKQKQLNRDFIDLCKRKDKGMLLADIDTVIAQGADVTTSGCKAMYLAVKNHNFALIDLLIERGILSNPLAIGYLAAMCDFGEFARVEDKFFERIDRAILLTGFTAEYIAPYVNSTFVHGEEQKALALSERYPISKTQIVELLHDRIIFEMIERDLVDGLALVNGYRDWIDERALGVAVSGGNVKIIRYMLGKKQLVPPTAAICDAIFHGYKDVLDLMDLRPNPIYRRSAESSKDTAMVEYLVGRGIIK